MQLHVLAQERHRLHNIYLNNNEHTVTRIRAEKVLVSAQQGPNRTAYR